MVCCLLVCGSSSPRCGLVRHLFSLDYCGLDSCFQSNTMLDFIHITYTNIYIASIIHRFIGGGGWLFDVVETETLTFVIVMSYNKGMSRPI